jgi:hypothetical protein
MFRASLAVARMLSRAFSVGFICVVGYGLKLLGFLRLLIPLLRVACFFLLSALVLSFFWCFSTWFCVFPLTNG